MKLSQYIKSLQETKKKHGDLEVVYSKDDEGNAFGKIVYAPSVGKFSNREFEQTEDNPDSVCVN